VATRPLSSNGLGMSTIDAQSRIVELRRTFILMPDTAGVFDNWLALVSHHDVKGKPSHHARLVAAMQVHGITQILTFNRGDFARYPGIMVLTPDEVVTQ